MEMSMKSLLMTKLTGVNEYVIPFGVFQGTNLEDYRVSIVPHPSIGVYSLAFGFSGRESCPRVVHDTVGDLDHVVECIAEYLDTRVYGRGPSGQIIGVSDDVEFIRSMRVGFLCESESRIPIAGSFEEYIESSITHSGTSSFELPEEVFSGTIMEGHRLTISKSVVDDLTIYSLSADRIIRSKIVFRTINRPRSGDVPLKTQYEDVGKTNLFKSEDGSILKLALNRIKAYLVTRSLDTKNIEFESRMDKGSTVSERARYYFGISH
jgi:hypothetical protein